MHREVVRIHSLESKIIRFIGEIGQMKRLTALFGGAQLLWVLPDNPEILKCLRASTDPNLTAAGAEPVRLHRFEDRQPDLPRPLPGFRHDNLLRSCLR